jgi:hypothetical protein
MSQAPFHSNWAGLPKPISQSVISKQLIQLIAQTTLPKKTSKEILKDINIQVLETKYVINLGQLLRIVPNIKRYIFKPIKSIQLVQLEHACVVVAIDHQMAVNQV